MGGRDLGSSPSFPPQSRLWVKQAPLGGLTRFDKTDPVRSASQPGMKPQDSSKVACPVCALQMRAWLWGPVVSLGPFCLVEVCLCLLQLCKTAEPSQSLQGQPPASSPTGVLRGQLVTYGPQGSSPAPRLRRSRRWGEGDSAGGDSERAGSAAERLMAMGRGQTSN